MAQPKRMSDIFASSSEKDITQATATATPPYSSEGPTLPILNENETTVRVPITDNPTSQPSSKQTSQNDKTTSQAQPTPTVHPSLYTPWLLLPPDLLNLLTSQSRLRQERNIIPIVFTKNQNVRSGINKLKTYLGAYKDAKSSLETPDALKQHDAIIAASAQGDGTSKLVGIIDMVKRFVKPTGGDAGMAGGEEKWYIYVSLTSVHVQRKRGGAKQSNSRNAVTTTDEVAEAEHMDIDEPVREEAQEEAKSVKTPVLTVWMTKKPIPAFKQAFGEQTFPVQKLRQ